MRFYPARDHAWHTLHSSSFTRRQTIKHVNLQLALHPSSSRKVQVGEAAAFDKCRAELAVHPLWLRNNDNLRLSAIYGATNLLTSARIEHSTDDWG